MNTKEKLELLWKYLFLAVIATGIFRFTDRHHPSSGPSIKKCTLS